MITMKILRIYVLFFITLLSSGCNKYLDKNPDPTKRVPTTLQDVDYFTNSATSGNAVVCHVADEFFIPAFNVNFNEEGRYFYKHWQYEFKSSWLLSGEIIYRNYKAIQVANAALDLLKNIPETNQNKEQFNKVKGKSHYFRASNYLYLAWAYCKAYDKATADSELGMPIDEDIYFGNKIKRATLKELYEYILKEADLAYSLLEPQYPLYGEINKAMAKVLLARIHLSMRNYDSAYKYSNEAILQRPDLLNYHDPEEVKIGTTTPFTNKNKEMIEIVPHGQTTISSGNAMLSGNEFFMDTILMASYHPNDLRVPAHFEKFGNYYKHYYTFYGSKGTGPGYYNNLLMGDEMYLVRAECNARLNRVSDAMKDLNDLLVTRFKAGTYVPYTTTDPAEALDIILLERRKSLVLRGLRWIDIKRLNLEGRNISITRKVDGVLYTLPANDKRFAMPLHSDMIDIWGYEQNHYD